MVSYVSPVRASLLHHCTDPSSGVGAPICMPSPIISSTPQKHVSSKSSLSETSFSSATFTRSPRKLKFVQHSVDLEENHNRTYIREAEASPVNDMHKELFRLEGTMSSPNVATRLPTIDTSTFTRRKSRNSCVLQGSLLNKTFTADEKQEEIGGEEEDGRSSASSGGYRLSDVEDVQNVARLQEEILKHRLKGQEDEEEEEEDSGYLPPKLDSEPSSMASSPYSSQSLDSNDAAPLPLPKPEIGRSMPNLNQVRLSSAATRSKLSLPKSHLPFKAGVQYKSDPKLAPSHNSRKVISSSSRGMSTPRGCGRILPQAPSVPSSRHHAQFSTQTKVSVREFPSSLNTNFVQKLQMEFAGVDAEEGNCKQWSPTALVHIWTNHTSDSEQLPGVLLGIGTAKDILNALLFFQLVPSILNK
ncbi:unnamed protein product [Darwinula stevensoni]|uniref:Uncharacterized protein n=1 Tax=Darwinula stevensoni TaxID=69355 RepID=A0A7R8XAY4_9CRUS|nr:unnamed protein product [Darwinula stevensoni]CAG0891077.1 unnamed protein product [Darwinula stevensoni]